MDKNTLILPNNWVETVMSLEQGCLDGLDQIKITDAYIEYFEPGWDSFMHRINLFEFAYKAKQWAVNCGYIVANDFIIKIDTQEVVIELENEDIEELKTCEPLADIKICLMIYNHITSKNQEK